MTTQPITTEQQVSTSQTTVELTQSATPAKTTVAEQLAPGSSIKAKPRTTANPAKEVVEEDLNLG